MFLILIMRKKKFFLSFWKILILSLRWKTALHRLYGSGRYLRDCSKINFIPESRILKGFFKAKPKFLSSLNSFVIFERPPYCCSKYSTSWVNSIWKKYKLKTSEKTEFILDMKIILIFYGLVQKSSIACIFPCNAIFMILLSSSVNRRKILKFPAKSSVICGRIHRCFCWKTNWDKNYCKRSDMNSDDNPDKIFIALCNRKKQLYSVKISGT